MNPRIALAPEGARGWLGDAVVAGGGALSPPGEAEALVWASPAKPRELADVLDANPQLRWVQLPWAGIEPYVDVIAAHPERTWTCGKGVYAEPVAEMALTLLLAGFRGFATYARASTWAKPEGRNLLGANVVVAGGGGIAQSFLRLLGPFGCRTTVVRRNPSPVAGADRVVGPDGLDDALHDADALVLALALTPETEHLIDRARLDRLGADGWLVNVARGRHVVTDDLVAALDEGTLGGAGLDVTDPEPLPEGHPLLDRPNVVVTPHIASATVAGRRRLYEHAIENALAVLDGRPATIVDP